MKNPYVALLRMAWTYDRQQKRIDVFVYFLFILANIARAANPLLFGWFVGKLQQPHTDIPSGKKQNNRRIKRK